MIAYILLEEALSIVTTNDWVRKLQILSGDDVKPCSHLA
jgi:hypothetical protein